MASNQIMLQPLPAGKEYQSFSLNFESIALLPDDHELIISTVTGFFVVVNWDARFFILEDSFNESELALMLVLLNAWPSYRQNEKLFQAITRQPLEEVIQLLTIAPDAALEPLHRLVDGCCKRLRPIGIEICNVNGLGYKLSRYIDRKEP